MTHEYPPKKVSTTPSSRLSLPIPLSLPNFDLAFLPHSKVSSPIPARPPLSSTSATTVDSRKLQLLTDRISTLEMELSSCKAEQEDAVESALEWKNRAEIAESGERELSLEVDQLRKELARATTTRGREGIIRRNTIPKDDGNLSLATLVEELRSKLAKEEVARFRAEKEVGELKRQVGLWKDLHDASNDKLDGQGGSSQRLATKSSGSQHQKGRQKGTSKIGGGESDTGAGRARANVIQIPTEYVGSEKEDEDYNWIEVVPSKVDLITFD